MKRVRNLFLMLTLVFVSQLSFGQVVKLENHQKEKVKLTCKRFDNFEKRNANKNVKSSIEPFNSKMVKREEIIIIDSDK